MKMKMDLESVDFMAYIKILVSSLRTAHMNTKAYKHYGYYGINNQFLRMAHTERDYMARQLQDMGFGVRYRGNRVDVYPIISLA